MVNHHLWPSCASTQKILRSKLGAFKAPWSRSRRKVRSRRNPKLSGCAKYQFRNARACRDDDSAIAKDLCFSGFIGFVEAFLTQWRKFHLSHGSSHWKAFPAAAHGMWVEAFKNRKILRLAELRKSMWIRWRKQSDQKSNSRPCWHLICQPTLEDALTFQCKACCSRCGWISKLRSGFVALRSVWVALQGTETVLEM